MNVFTLPGRGRHIVGRGIIILAVAMAGLFAASAPASAHASIQMYGATATSGSYGAIFIRIPHAAAGLSTNVIEVQIPSGVTSVKPQQVAGWSEKVNYATDGTTATSVSWSGGNLPDTSFQDFGVQVKFPATPGATLYFKTVQTLNDGSQVAWIEVPGAGVDAHSLAHPAPSVVLSGSTVTAPGTHTPTAPTVAPMITGELIASADGSKIRVVADLNRAAAGKTAVLRLVEGTNKVTTTVTSVKLDSRGDLSRTVVAAKTGSTGYRIDSGDMLELVIDSKVVASATI